MAVNIDVIIKRHAADAPFRVHERRRRQRRQRRRVQLRRLTPSLRIGPRINTKSC
jgi:hypothetical protein